MLKIQRSSNGEVVFTLIGRIEMEHVTELRRLLSLERAGSPISFDLKDVTLAERTALKFLSDCESDSISLKNCPAYVRQWINRDKERKNEREPGAQQ
jgi:hypothetical protein